jgi:hypothetical protein
MAPLAIDDEKFAKQETLDMSKPQGTPHGLPVKQIAHLEYPRAVYKHPLEPFQRIEHRNAQREVVQVEVVPTEHLVHVCQDETEFDTRLKQGWVTKPYIPKAPEDPATDLYRSKGAKEQAPAKGQAA